MTNEDSVEKIAERILRKQNREKFLYTTTTAIATRLMLREVSFSLLCGTITDH